MSEIAIKVYNVSKKYTIGHSSTGSLKETITGFFNRNGKKSKEEFWALKDISFEVGRGEAMGIIGKNGAGKSTLLKVLSRITEPSTGRIEIIGRVSSLLEVGTGFHPELTGRENVYLNGTILGMKRNEIKSKFDEIVDFSGVEKFLDTPIKRYSSGMKVRLAFSVAAFLDPEILLIDEVLAVGDAEFQAKCLGKMGEVLGQGRTIIFVSHNMSAVQNLCNASILLKNGRKILDGPVNDTIKYYLTTNTENSYNELLINNREGNSPLRLDSIKLYDSDLNILNALATGIDCYIELIYSNNLYSGFIEIEIGIYNSHNEGLVYLSNKVLKKKIFVEKDTSFNQKIFLPKLALVSGIYSFFVKTTLDIGDFDRLGPAFKVKVLDGDYYNTGMSVSPRNSKILMNYEFK